MKDFTGKIAVITGAGTGMGRELARQLVSEGCHVALCDVLMDNLAETEKLCHEVAAPDTRITIHKCDVSEEKQVIAFHDAVRNEHQTTHINLLFNNAGIGGGGSFLLDDKVIWDKTFGSSWFGVYYCCRAFMPMLVASDEGHIINTSSVNGFWACLGPTVPHTAYSAAKFAIKGFTEALQVDLRLNAPHVKASVVMPGHIGTDIGINTNRILGLPSIEEMTNEQLTTYRDRMVKWGNLTEDLNLEEFRSMLIKSRNDFRDNAPMSASEAAKVILDAVRNKTWRVLVGEDAKLLDQIVRGNPEDIYSMGFFQKLQDHMPSALKKGE